MVNRSFRLPRIWSNRVLRRIAPCFQGEVVNVSGWMDGDKEGGVYRDYFASASAYYVTNHEGARGLDDAGDVTDFALDLTRPLPEALLERFDVVFCHTVLEHVFDVIGAFRNLCAMSRDVVLVVVPFAQETHTTESYGDYWRFTPMGLRSLFRANGLETVYEAATPYPNAGIYLLFAGSKRPEAWHGRLPPFEPVEHVGGWIGRPNLALRAIARLVRPALTPSRSRSSRRTAA